MKRESVLDAEIMMMDASNEHVCPNQKKMTTLMQTDDWDNNNMSMKSWLIEDKEVQLNFNMES